MPHGGLCRPRGNPALAQQRAEGVPQGVNVEGPAPVVALRDAGSASGRGRGSCTSSAGTSNSGVSGGSRAGIGSPASAGFRLQPAQLVGEPVAQVRRQVVPQRRCRSLPGSFRRRRRARANGTAPSRCSCATVSGRQLALAQPGQHQRLVDQGPFPAEPVPAVPALRGARRRSASPFRGPLRTVRASSSGRRRATSSSLHQFGFGHRPALSARVGLLVRLRHGVERVRRRAGSSRRTSCRRTPAALR